MQAQHASPLLRPTFPRLFSTLFGAIRTSSKHYTPNTQAPYFPPLLLPTLHFQTLLDNQGVHASLTRKLDTQTSCFPPPHTSILCFQTLLDNQDFHADQADLDALDFKSDLSEDFVMVRRLAITRADPIRNMNLPEKVRTAPAKCGEVWGVGTCQRALSLGGGLPVRCDVTALAARGRPEPYCCCSHSRPNWVILARRHPCASHNSVMITLIIVPLPRTLCNATGSRPAASLRSGHSRGPVPAMM